ncbi:MAG: sulfatase family protein [Verrucomicrobiota bacterium]
MTSAPVLPSASLGQTLRLAGMAMLLLGGVASARTPNILLILADDLGYGDVRCYNDQAKVPTPNLDRLAREGARFTDAHSPATVCTPSRYGLLTGQMPFRIPKGGTVFTGTGGPSLIAAGRLTMPAMLKARGYATAAVGKWHVGLTFRDAAGAPLHAGRPEDARRIDYARRIEGGPLDHGFESFFGTACCPGTDWLYAYIEGDRIPTPPTGPLDRAKLPRHPYANDCRPGIVAPDFDLPEIDERFLQRSREFLARQARAEPRRPFFLYHATQAVHLPSFASKDYRGKSSAGPHGDFIAEFDAHVGLLLADLEKHGLAEDTLVIISSDNGPETTSALRMRADHGHDGARPWRGVKRDAWEGGHRVPLIVRWPRGIKPGLVSERTVSLTDVMATVAEITGQALPVQSAEDSLSFLPTLESRPQPARPFLLTQAAGGAATLSVRKGPWKLIAHAGSGGNRYDRGELLALAPPGGIPNESPQLYDLSRDPGETTNVAKQHPEIVTELQTLLTATRSSGRSRP